MILEHYEAQRCFAVAAADNV